MFEPVLTLIIGLFVNCDQSVAQEPPDPQEMHNGVDYTFERTFATRNVDDAYDRGQLSLVVYIWRPVVRARHEVVLSATALSEA